MIDMTFEKCRQLVDLFLYFGSFVCFQIAAMIQMYISRLLIRCEQPFLQRLPIHLVRRNVAGPARFKRSFILQNPLLHKVCLTLEHHDETVPVIFKMADVVLAEISPVKNKSDPPVSVSPGFVYRTLEL